MGVRCKPPEKRLPANSRSSGPKPSIAASQSGVKRLKLRKIGGFQVTLCPSEGVPVLGGTLSKHVSQADIAPGSHPLIETRRRRQMNFAKLQLANYLGSNIANASIAAKLLRKHGWKRAPVEFPPSHPTRKGSRRSFPGPGNKGPTSWDFSGTNGPRCCYESNGRLPISTTPTLMSIPALVMIAPFEESSTVG